VKSIVVVLVVVLVLLVLVLDSFPCPFSQVH